MKFLAFIVASVIALATCQQQITQADLDCLIEQSTERAAEITQRCDQLDLINANVRNTT